MAVTSWLGLILTAVAGAASLRGGGRCEPMEIEQCKSVLPYNRTAFPNLVGNEEMTDAELQLTTFEPLVQVECASELLFFLCSVYAPMCTPQVPVQIGPCRPLCEKVRRQCAPTLENFGFPWPTSLNCSQFPAENNADAMCMKGPVREPKREPSTAFHHPPPAYDHGAPLRPAVTSCVEHGRAKIRINRTRACTVRCSTEDLYSRTEKATAETAVFILACLSAATGILGLALLRCSRAASSLSYPELPLVFIVLCSLLGSVPAFVRFAAGRDAVSCVALSSGLRVLVGAGLEHIPCTVLGIATHFFATAGRLWWALLAWLWFLHLGLSWSTAALSLHGFGYHVWTWAASLVAVVAGIVTQSIEADELSGACALGWASSPGILYARLIPEAVLLTLGAIPLLLIVLSLLCQTGERRAKRASLEGRAYWAGGIATLAYVPIGTTLVCCYAQVLSAGPASFHAQMLRLVVEGLYGPCVGVALVLRLLPCPATPGSYAQPDKMGSNVGYAHQPVPSSGRSSGTPWTHSAYGAQRPLYSPSQPHTTWDV